MALCGHVAETTPLRYPEGDCPRCIAAAECSTFRAAGGRPPRDRDQARMFRQVEEGLVAYPGGVR